MYHRMAKVLKDSSHFFLDCPLFPKLTIYMKNARIGASNSKSYISESIHSAFCPKCKMCAVRARHYAACFVLKVQNIKIPPYGRNRGDAYHLYNNLEIKEALRMASYCQP